MSEAVTEAIRVQVTPQYVEEQSSPEDGRFVFAYSVRIVNEGEVPVQLRSRHWIITDGHGRMEQVRGAGVVGEQPTLDPGGEYTYTSGCILGTPMGTMHGSYQMHREDGTMFDAEIAPFLLSAPQAAADKNPGPKQYLH